MDIRNCQIKFRCPKRWDALISTGDKQVRHCNECQRDVHFCEDKNSLMIAMQNDWCVAIPIDPLLKPKPDNQLSEPSGFEDGTPVEISNVDEFLRLPDEWQTIDDDNIIMGDIAWTEASPDREASPGIEASPNRETSQNIETSPTFNPQQVTHADKNESEK